jgi:hypothetical protein
MPSFYSFVTLQGNKIQSFSIVLGMDNNNVIICKNVNIIIKIFILFIFFIMTYFKALETPVNAQLYNLYMLIYLIDTICITSSQNTTKFIALYCTICCATTCFGLFIRPSSGCICLALRVLYHDNVYYFDDDISIILTLALLWPVCRQLNMIGYRPRVWVGSDGKCCYLFGVFSVSIVVSGFSYSAQSLRCLLLCHSGKILSMPSRYNMTIA